MTGASPQQCVAAQQCAVPVPGGYHEFRPHSSLAHWHWVLLC